MSHICKSALNLFCIPAQMLCQCGHVAVVCMQVYKLNPERLYATYFEGDAKQGLEPDNEAREIWCSAHLAQRACRV